jgi:hypothetical protein
MKKAEHQLGFQHFLWGDAFVGVPGGHGGSRPATIE